MTEVINTSSIVYEDWKIELTYPHEIADDLIGFDFFAIDDDKTTNYNNPVWRSMFGSSIAMDEEQIRMLIKELANMQQRIQSANSR